MVPATQNGREEKNNRKAFKDMGTAYSSFSADMAAVKTSQTMEALKENWAGQASMKKWNEGGFEGRLKSISENTPVWRSIPIAALLGPPVEELFEKHKKDACGGILFGVDDKMV